MQNDYTYHAYYACIVEHRAYIVYMAYIAYRAYRAYIAVYSVYSLYSLYMVCLYKAKALITSRGG